MTIRPLTLLPDPLLRQVSRSVSQVDDAVRRLANDMLDTMYDAPGIGLAGVQIGEPVRILVIDLAKEDEEKAPQVFINPQILSVSDDRSIHEEGCLSIPDYFADVERPASAQVRFVDLTGREQEIKASGLLATCLQHEMDHLDGILFIDHISRLKREMVVKKFTKLSRQRGANRMAG